jgi:hypothetical protein
MLAAVFGRNWLSATAKIVAEVQGVDRGRRHL